jgi:rhamnogalacturonan endolyase
MHRLLAMCLVAGIGAAADLPVTALRDASGFTLSNGLIQARISETGDVLSLHYKGLELLGQSPTRSNGYWSLPGTDLNFGRKLEASLLDDPARNGGERATASCRFTYDGAPRTVPADVEIVYSLARGDTALYLEARWVHRASYPRLTFPVGRFAAKLNDAIFDWMTIDRRRNLQMITAYDWDHGTPLNMKEARRMNTGIRKGQVEHKYDYAAVQFQTPAYGWSSTREHVGMWLVTPSYEYMSGGPTKVELTAHPDATFTDSLTDPAPPVILNVWKGPHYGGTALDVPQGEEWRKTIGPFLLYANSAPTPDAMWRDAVVSAATETHHWPYDWAVADDYPGKNGRGTVNGRIVLNDPAKPAYLLVGLAHPGVDWQKDAQYYQFWARAESTGRFTIPNVRPGAYTLHAFSDGVLGEFEKADITVKPGESLDLGALTWTPVRYGRQIWEIGIPDRTAGEFLHGNQYWQWGLYYQYPKDFPDDVHYVVGKSDYRKDWNIMQVPRAIGDTGRGTATTWSVSFELPEALRGRATLRLSLAGTEAKQIDVTMDDQPIGTITGLPNTMVIHRDADRGWWQEKDVVFDAAVMKAGTNILKLTIPAGPVTAGVEYDYLRLEVEERQ